MNIVIISGSGLAPGKIVADSSISDQDYCPNSLDQDRLSGPLSGLVHVPTLGRVQGSPLSITPVT